VSLPDHLLEDDQQECEECGEPMKPSRFLLCAPCRAYSVDLYAEEDYEDQIFSTLIRRQP
jgi:hypothetical protein